MTNNQRLILLVLLLVVVHVSHLFGVSLGLSKAKSEIHRLKEAIVMLETECRR